MADTESDLQSNDQISLDSSTTHSTDDVFLLNKMITDSNQNSQEGTDDENVAV